MTVELKLLSRVSFRGQPIPGARLGGLLALLADDLRAGCGSARLIEELWPDALPEHPAKALQILVSRARARLGRELIVSTPTGYRLALAEDQVDAAAVVVHDAQAARLLREGDHAGALKAADDGLALWDPPAVPDVVPDDPLAALRRARAATHLGLRRSRALALSRLGRHAEALQPLAAVAAERPRDEEVLVALLRSEAATAGPSAALARYETYRQGLLDDLGSEPGEALQRTHRELLQVTLPTVRHGVIGEPNPLVGRADDVAAVEELLHTARVVSIVGPGGLGKTRLAQAVARDAPHRVVHVVPLAGVTNDDVVREISAAVGVTEAGRAPLGRVTPVGDVAGIARALGSGPALLVLDNCEHVVGEVARLVQALVAISSDVRVLTTSRTPLGLSSESVYQLPALSLSDAAELFGQRARAVRPGVALPAGQVAELCRRLDGLPLAVELAAARLRTMSVAEVARGLDDRFGLLRGGSRDAPERHRTLHAVVDWSWNLLSASGQEAMRVLSVFPGGFTAAAAQHVLGGDDVHAVLEELVDQSLLTVEDTPAGARFSMLETVRAFSAEQRHAADEDDRVVDRFLAWARDFGVTYHGAPFGADPYELVPHMSAEQDNIQAALRHALERGDGATVAATTAVLAGLRVLTSNFTQLGALARDTAWVLSHYRPEPEMVEVARTALTLSTTYVFVIEGPRATRQLVALRRLPPGPPDTLVRAIATVLTAVPLDDDSLDAMCDSDEPLLAAAANGIASYLLEGRGDVEGACVAAERMVTGFDRARSLWFWGMAHARVSELCVQLERGAQARQHLEAALPVVDHLGAAADVAGIRWLLVLASLQSGDVDEAERWLEQTVACGPEGDIFGLTYGLGVCAEILLARGAVDAGLAQWREVVERMHVPPPRTATDPTGLAVWIAEAQAVTVVAHAHHDRLDLVAGLVADLPGKLAEVLDKPAVSPFLVEAPVHGALLVALAMVDLVRGRAAGDEQLLRSGARMVALAERFRFVRSFQPTMSSERIRRAAERADRPAYADAVSEFAGLHGEPLREAARTMLRERQRAGRTGSRL